MKKSLQVVNLFFYRVFGLFKTLIEAIKSISVVNLGDLKV